MAAHPDPRRARLSPRARGRGRQIRALCLLLVLLPVSFPPEAAPPYRGRSLVEVLRELQRDGLSLIYSTAVVGSELIVPIEPRSTDPRALLVEILEPLGLAAEPGAGASLVIVARRPRGRLSGHIAARLHDTPVAGAAIRLEGLDLAAVSRKDGTFDLPDVPQGRYTVRVQAPGFWPVTLPGVRVDNRAETEISVRLHGQPTFVAEVVVTPRLTVERHEQAPWRTVDNEDTVLVPTVGGEVTHVIDLLPGVASGDNSAAFHVRGNDKDDVSVILDGLELYDPFHLKSFQSPFSLVDGQVVERIDFLGGGYTAELGDRNGGFVEISTLLPELANRGEIELGTLNSRAAFAGQSEDGSRSWLVALRGWYPEAISDTIELGGGERVDPRFADAYAKVTFVVSPQAIVSAHGLLAYDRLTFVEPADVDGPGEVADALTRNGYLWLRARYSGRRVTTQTVFSGGRIQRFRSGFSRPQEDEFVVDDERDVDFLGLKHDAAVQLSSGHLLKAGLELRRLEAEYGYDLRPVAEPDDGRLLAFTERGVSLAAYVSHRLRVSDRVAAEVGLRWDRQTYTGDNQLSPRFNAIWQPGPRTELRAGVGRFSQSQRIHELRVEDGETAYQPAEIARQVDLTVEHGFTSGLRLRFDAYYSELDDLRPRYENLFEPLELFPETGSDRVRIAPDAARLRGAEMLLRGQSGRPWTWWVSYAIASAEDEIDGVLVPRAWDQGHSLKALVGRRVGERWSFSLSGTAHTGWPTTPVSGREIVLPDGSTEFEPVPGPRNTDRFGDYLRWDAKLVRTIDLSRGRLRFALDLANLTDRENPCCVDEFEFSSGPGGEAEVRRVDDYWLGFTPSFAVLWEF